MFNPTPRNFGSGRFFMAARMAACLQNESHPIEECRYDSAAAATYWWSNERGWEQTSRSRGWLCRNLAIARGGW